MMRGASVLTVLVLAGCAGAPQVALAPAAAPDDLQAQVTLDAALAGTPPTQGNRVTVLRDGAQTLPAMFAAIAAARDSVNLEYYVFQDLHVAGDTLADLLVRKLGEGVAVNVIRDAYGSQDTDPAFPARLQAAGARLLVFHPLDATAALDLKNPNDRDHRKIMVIDGRVAFVGGINLDRVYENPPNPQAAAESDTQRAYWRDTDARIEGPAVAELERLFLATWAHEHGPPLPPRAWFPPLAADGTETVRIVGSAPGDDRPLYYVALLSAIHVARHSIALSTGYFVPTHQEREELAKAARRGVAVRLVLPAVSDSPGALASGRAAYGDLLEAGVRIYEVHGAVLHSKVAVVDGVWTTIGSSNLDRRSVAFNNEVDAIALGRATAASVSALLDRDMAQAREITLAAWRARPLGEQIDEYTTRLWGWLL